MIRENAKNKYRNPSEEKVAKREYRKNRYKHDRRWKEQAKGVSKKLLDINQ